MPVSAFTIINADALSGINFACVTAVDCTTNANVCMAPLVTLRKIAVANINVLVFIIMTLDAVKLTANVVARADKSNRMAFCSCNFATLSAIMRMDEIVIPTNNSVDQMSAYHVSNNVAIS